MLRWAFCAVFSGTVGDACDLSCVIRSTWDFCVANCYNNTPKDCIVNLFCLVMDICVVPFGSNALSMLLSGKVEHYNSGKTHSTL